MSKKVLILAGGGGHTGYGYALAQSLHGRASLHFLVPKGDELSRIRMSKFGEVKTLTKPRGPKTPHHQFILRFFRAIHEASKLVSSDYDVVVSTGSNFCIAPAFFAWLRGLPIVNIESPVRFTRASRTARILQPISTITALHWPEQKRFLKGTVVGPMLPKPETKLWNGGYILVTGGSYGHRALFDVISESDLEDVVMQTGRVSPEPYQKKRPSWRILRFSSEFHELIAGAKLVVTHFGSTVLEALIYRKPMVIVPNPEWTRTVGIEDARYLAKKVNAVVVSVITQETLLEAMERAANRELPELINGSNNLANLILEL